VSAVSQVPLQSIGRRADDYAVDVAGTVGVDRRGIRLLSGTNRWIVPALLFLLAISTMTSVVRARSVRDVAPEVASAERRMVLQINQLRAGRGLGVLVGDGELRRVADAWTATMSSDGSISHNPDLATQIRGPWRRVGENVGSGDDPDAVFDGFVASPEHLHNLLDPSYDVVAVTMRNVDGEWFITQNFADVPNGTHLGPDDPGVPELLQAAVPNEA
jgi:Cysteine-rich secretory protein family